MFLFRNRAQKELDFILGELKNFLSNNYKDAAHTCRKQLGEKSEAFYQEGKLTRAQYLRYRELYKHYTKLMENYHH